MKSPVLDVTIYCLIHTYVRSRSPYQRRDDGKRKENKKKNRGKVYFDEPRHVFLLFVFALKRSSTNPEAYLNSTAYHLHSCCIDQSTPSPLLLLIV